MPTTGWSSGEQDTCTAALSRAAQQTPNRIFLDFAGTEYSYAAIEREATRLAHGLAEIGVRHGQCVGTLLDNNVDAITIWFAINKLGAISVPINTAYRGEFLRHQLADAGAQVIVAECDYAERVLAVENDLPEARVLLHRGDVPPQTSQRLDVRPLDTARSEDISPIEDRVLPRDVCALIYTAGTTGPSKGCMISHNYMCNLARQAIAGTARTGDDVAWTALPLFHLNATSTTIMATLLSGGKACIYPRFSVSNFWPEVKRTGATIVSLLGSMAPLLAAQPDTPESVECYGQIRVARGAPFPAELQETWKRRFGIKTAGSMAYGLTEASVVTSLKDGEYAKPGSSGRSNDDFDVRIVDDEDNELPPGTPGEIIVRPKKPHVMFEGYWRREADTLRLMRNLWFHTGDIGMFDDEGFFFFVDRKKDYLRRRGENISSFEMETSFRAHPAIQDVAVHAVSSEFTEDDVKVTAVLKPDTALSEEELCRWAIERLPYFCVPRYIEFRGELPRNPVGRVLKYQLRDEGVTAATWDIEKSAIELKKR